MANKRPISEVDRLEEHGVQCGLGVFSLPVNRKRRPRIKVGSGFQADIPAVALDSRERGDVLVRVELSVVPLSKLGGVLAPERPDDASSGKTALLSQSGGE
jgi:hypothetical protein